MLLKLLIPSCLCLLLTQAVASSSHYYPSYNYYPAPQVYNNYTTVYQPYAVPLYSIGYTPPTAVISGSVAYQQQITTLATAGAATQVQSSVVGVLGAEVQQQQQLSLEQRFDRLLAVMERQAGIGGAQAQKQLPPHIAEFKNNCMGCHKGATAKKKFMLFDDAENFVATADDVGTIIFRLTTKKTDAKGKPLRMPPPGDTDFKLDPEVKDTMIEGLLQEQPQQKAEQPQHQPRPYPQRQELPPRAESPQKKLPPDVDPLPDPKKDIPPDPKKKEGPF